MKTAALAGGACFTGIKADNWSDLLPAKMREFMSHQDGELIYDETYSNMDELAVVSSKTPAFSCMFVLNEDGFCFDSFYTSGTIRFAVLNLGPWRWIGGDERRYLSVPAADVPQTARRAKQILKRIEPLLGYSDEIRRPAQLQPKVLAVARFCAQDGILDRRGTSPFHHVSFQYGGWSGYWDVCGNCFMEGEETAQRREFQRRLKSSGVMARI